MPRDVHYNTFMWALQAFGYFGIFGVLFNIYLLRLGYGTEQIGLMVGAGPLAWGLGAVPAGMIGRRVGNRDPALWGVAIITGTTFLLLLVEFLPTAWQTAWIAGWWIVCWLGVALQNVNSAPFVMSLCAPEERSRAFTAQMMAQGVGALSGSLVAGILPGFIASITGTTLDSSTPYWISLWLAPLFYFGGFWVFSHTRRVAGITSTVSSHHEAKMPIFLIFFVAILVLLQTFGEGVVRSFFNVYLDSSLAVPISQIGLVMGFAQALPIFATLAAPWVVSRCGNAGTIIVAGTVMAFFLLVLAFFPSYFAAAGGYIGFMLILPTASIARTLFGQEIVTPEWRTSTSTANAIGLSLGWATASALGGYVIVAYGYHALFIFGALMSIISGLLVFTFLRMGARARANTAQASAS